MNIFAGKRNIPLRIPSCFPQGLINDQEIDGNSDRFNDTDGK